MYKKNGHYLTVNIKNNLESTSNHPDLSPLWLNLCDKKKGKHGNTRKKSKKKD